MIKVALTGLNAGDSPAPGVAVARCLREHPEWRGKIIGLGYDALESGILDPKMVDSAYLLPYPSSGKEALLERMISIHDLESLDVIIPNLDSEIPNFIAIESELHELGIRVALPTFDQYRLRAKSSLPKFCQDAGVRTPKTVQINSANDLRHHELKFPIMVKGVFHEAHVAHTRDAALHFIHRISAMWGFPVLLQEQVIGEEFNLAAIGDGKGGIVQCAAMKKLVLTEKRKGWACISIQNRELLEFAETTMKHLKWNGPIEIEAMQSAENGELYLIELNPRFPAWIYLAKAAGANLPFTLLSRMLGITSAELSDARPGVVFTNYTTNLVAELSNISTLFTNGELQHEQYSKSI